MKKTLIIILVFCSYFSISNLAFADFEFSATINPDSLVISEVYGNTQIWQTDDDGNIIGSPFYDSDAGPETKTYGEVVTGLGFPAESRGKLCGTAFTDCDDDPDYDFWTYGGEFHTVPPEDEPPVTGTTTIEAFPLSRDEVLLLIMLFLVMASLPLWRTLLGGWGKYK